MKVFVPIFALLAMVAAGGKEYEMMKKWAWGKAMGSCFGEANHKFMMKQWKMHAAECKGVDAPELDLPFFNTPFRTASSLMNGAMSEEKSGFTEKLFMKFMREQMMEKFSHSKHNHDDDDHKSHSHYRRYRRDSEDKEIDTLDLGDRLIEKLAAEKYKMQAKVGNFTCMLQKCGIINEETDLQVDQMITFMKEGLPEPVNPWVLERVIEDKQKCYDFVEAIPANFFEKCSYGPKLGKVKMFMKCCKMSKAKTCMANDIRQNLEENFGTVDELLEESELEEDELYALVGSLMAVDM